MNDCQTARIEEMEAALDDSAAALAALSEALDGYEAVLERYRGLEAYYGSPQWRADFEDDEAGRLPDGLKRGVLSEDAVYDLITDHEQLLERLRGLLSESEAPAEAFAEE